MTACSTTVRATHLLTNTAWFGGSLLGAVALNPAARQGHESRERGEIADVGCSRWTPGQRAAMGSHLLRGVAILADDRRRVLAHPPTRTAVVAKTGFTGVAVTASATAFRFGAKLGDTRITAQGDAAAGPKARLPAARMRWLQWATPAATAVLLVLDAYCSERQRGLTGLLDRPSNPLHRS